MLLEFEESGEGKGGLLFYVRGSRGRGVTEEKLSIYFPSWIGLHEANRNYGCVWLLGPV
jgi:hypothetical protein